MPPRREPAPEPTTLDMICQFNKLNPPKFQGGADPLKYEGWKRKLKNLFEIMECPDRYKVALTTYHFEGEAEFWWGTVKPRVGEDPITRDRLVELLDSKYYPRDVQRTKEREFLCLKQGHMTVMEYAARFNELSRFTMHQVNTEDRKMDHFEQGLRGDIKSVIAGQTFTSFQDMYRRAVKVARVLEENEKETQILNLERKRREQFRQNCQNRTEKRSRSDYPPENGKHPMSQTSNNPPCQYCGKPHGGICLFREGRCFECRERGHKRSECPKLAGKQDRAPPSAGPPRPSATGPSTSPTRGRLPAPGTAPRTRNNNKPQARGRVFCLEAEEEGDEEPSCHNIRYVSRKYRACHSFVRCGRYTLFCKPSSRSPDELEI